MFRRIGISGTHAISTSIAFRSAPSFGEIVVASKAIPTKATIKTIACSFSEAIPAKAVATSSCKLIASWGAKTVAWYGFERIGEVSRSSGATGPLFRSCGV
jgi:hypothetical protein